MKPCSTEIYDRQFDVYITEIQEKYWELYLTLQWSYLLDMLLK